MIAALDTLIRPLDPAIGFFLLLAVAVGWILARLFDRARRETQSAAPDPHAPVYGDVPEVGQ